MEEDARLLLVTRWAKDNGVERLVETLIKHKMDSFDVIMSLDDR